MDKIITQDSDGILFIPVIHILANIDFLLDQTPFLGIRKLIKIKYFKALYLIQNSKNLIDEKLNVILLIKPK